MNCRLKYYYDFDIQLTASHINKCTMSIPRKVGDIHNNEPNQRNWWPCCAATPGLLLSRSASVTTTSELMRSASPPGRRGWGQGEGLRDTDSKHSERGKERERRDGCCLLWHTLTHHWVTAAGRREHPSLILFRKTRAAFLFSELLKISPGSTLFNTIRAWDAAEVRGTERGSGVKAEGSFSTRDSDHGSNGGGGVSARWVQIPFQYAHTSSLKCFSPLVLPMEQH